MDMKKCCPSCGTLNKMSADACTECSGDLTYAEEVYDGPLSASAASDKGEPSVNARPGNGEQPHQHTPMMPDDGTARATFCTCQRPMVEPGLNQCAYCGDQVQPQDVEQAVAPSAAKPDAATQENEMVGEMVAILPGNLSFPVRTGLPLGRDGRFASEPVARALADYPGVSRRHLWIGCDKQTLLLLDLGSRNGTWLNGKQLPACILCRESVEAGDIRLRLGKRLEIAVQMEAER